MGFTLHQNGSVCHGLLTIAIPTFNRPSHIVGALASIEKQNRFSADIQVLIVNNSQDEEIKRKYRNVLARYSELHIRYVENPSNIGMFGNWNRCISLCETPYITILNDDDRLRPQFLERCIPLLGGENLIVTRARIINGSRSRTHKILKSIYILTRKKLHRSSSKKHINPGTFLSGNSIHASLGVIFKKDAALAQGGFLEKKYPAADVFFTHTYALTYGVTYIFEELADYVWGDNNATNPEVAKLLCLREYQLRQWYLINFCREATLYRVAKAWSVMHLKSKRYSLQRQISTPLEMGRLDLILAKYPTVPMYIINLGWQILGFFLPSGRGR